VKNLYAYTEPHNTYPAYISVNEGRESDTVRFSVRSKGAQSASEITLTTEQAATLADQLPSHPTVGAAYGIIDPDYARVFTQARVIAWQYGYACVVHGSFTRDLDLLLVPWEDRAGPNHDQLLKLIADACGLRFKDGKDVMEATPDYTEKPHGRLACSLFFRAPGDRRWVDISIMPCDQTA